MEQPIETDTSIVSYVEDDVPNEDCGSQLGSSTQRRTFPHYDFSNTESLSRLQTSEKSISHSLKTASNDLQTDLKGDKSEGTYQ